MGHAAQDLSGDAKQLGYNDDLLEPMNLGKYESPIAKELGEPIRENYYDVTGTMDMENSTHFRTYSPIDRPWWFYWLFWNWGKPSYTIVDRNVGN